jgi:tetratricopeptide (TPR) repeat protein
MSCPGEETIIAFAAGTYPVPLREELEAHLNECSDCYRLVAFAARSVSRTIAADIAEKTTTFPDNELTRIDNFELIRVIGRGGMGIVYEARCIDSGERVALKKARRGGRHFLAAMRREIRALQRIPHPGVVQIKSEGCAREQPFYVMEFVEGPSFAESLSHRAANSSTWPTVLRRVCTTLTFLHGQGIVHRDLSPRNILLRGSMQPVLVDFGLASYFPGAVGRDVLDPTALAAGTVAYVAPEQIRGELVDARADLYSLGCILYEALTGRPPFVASSVREILRAHLHEQPVAPSKLCEGIAPSLEAVTMALLAKEPRNRPGYADDIGSVLEAHGGEDWETAPPPPAFPHLYRPSLVGRDPWRAKFRAAFQHCRAGRGTRLFIAGEPGAGKTRLVTEAIMLARDQGLQVVATEGMAILGPTSAPTQRTAPGFQSSRLLLREIVDQCAIGETPVENDAGLWRRLIGDLEKIFAVDGSWPIESSVSEGPASDRTRVRMFAGLRQILTMAAAARPLLLVIDDLHWADDLTLDFLRSLPNDFFETNAIVLVGAYREEEISKPLAGILANTAAQQLPSLDRLGPESIRRMITEILALDAVPSSFSDLLSEVSNGTPFFVAEYVRMAVAAKWLVRVDGGRWTFQNDSSHQHLPRLPLSHALRGLIHRRLGLLSPALRTIVDLASVSGRNLSTEVLARAHGISEIDMIDALNELTVRQVLEPATPLRFVHDQVREAAYALLGEDVKRRLHRALAEAIEAVPNAQRTGAVHAELAYHWASAGRIDKAMPHAEVAGQHAFATGAYREAVTHFGNVINWAKTSSGDAPDVARLGSWERWLGEAHYCLGDIDVGEAHLLSSLRAFGVDPPMGGRALLGPMKRMLETQIFRARGRLPLRGSLPRPFEDAALAAARLAHLRVWKNDSGATLAATLLAVSLGDALPGGAPSARPYSQLAFMAGLARLRPLERAYFKHAREIAEARNNASELGHSYYAEAYLRTGEGQWRDARRVLDRALVTLDGKDNLPDWETALAVRGVIARWTGRWEEALECAAAIRASAESYGNIEHRVWSIVLAGSSLIRLGRVDETVPLLRLGLELLAARPEWVCELRTNAHLAYAFVELGDFDQATRAASRSMSILERSNGPPMMVSAIDGIFDLADAWLRLLEHGAQTAPRADVFRQADRALSYCRKVAALFPIGRPPYLALRTRHLVLQAKPARAYLMRRRAETAAKRFPQISESRAAGEGPKPGEAAQKTAHTAHRQPHSRGD